MERGHQCGHLLSEHPEVTLPKSGGGPDREKPGISKVNIVKIHCESIGDFRKAGTIVLAGWNQNNRGATTAQSVLIGIGCPMLDSSHPNARKMAGIYHIDARVSDPSDSNGRLADL